MTYIEFRERMKVFPAFSIREIEKYFPGFDSRRLVEWQEKGYITKLRNRFYLFSDLELNESLLFYTANELYKPSYVSLESALSVYGIIPEGVFQITSCTTLKTSAFNTPIGVFSYRNLKPALFFGYYPESWNNHHYALARPEKAIIDYLYLHHEMQTIEDINALRWNAVEIKKRVSADRMKLYEEYIESPALSRRLSLLRKFLDANA